MKFGFLVDKPSFGGGERILNMLIDSFVKSGHTVVIYTWNSEWKNYVAKYDIQFLDGSLIGLKNKLNAYIGLKKRLKKTEPDCLIIFALGLAEVGVWSAKSAHIPTILSERCDPRFMPQSRLHRFLRLIVFCNSSGIVFQTETVRKFFPRKIRRKGIVIQNPIMDDNLPFKSGDSKKEIVAIGRLSEEKRFDILIHAFGEINNDLYVLRIFGDGPLRSGLTNLIKELNLTDRVFLEGNVNRVVDYIADADIYVSCSLHEGMSNSLIEAMAIGLACISTDVPSGSARVLIQQNINGIIIPCEDKEALKLSLQKLINDEAFKENIKRNALKIRLTNSKEAILPQWIKFIEYVIKSK